MHTPPAMTARQKRFLAAYLDEASPTKGNASASAHAAGYANERSIGSRLLTNVNIAAAIAAHEQAVADAVLARGIAVRTNRLALLDDLAERHKAVIAARAEAGSLEEAPGAATGLLVRTYKQLGTGPTARLVEEWAVDTATSAELRATLKQAAQELGQWTEKRELSGTVVQQIVSIEAVAPHADLPPLHDD